MRWSLRAELCCLVQKSSVTTGLDQRLRSRRSAPPPVTYAETGPGRFRDTCNFYAESSKSIRALNFDEVRRNARSVMCGQPDRQPLFEARSSTTLAADRLGRSRGGDFAVNDGQADPYAA
jgi:hypothetical protein